MLGPSGEMAERFLQRLQLPLLVDGATARAVDHSRLLARDHVGE
jgi:hypothetical protein